MKAILAQPREFYAGVVRAVDVVEAAIGRVTAPVHIVQSVGYVAALVLADSPPVAYVTQTTPNVGDRKSIIGALEERFSNIIGPQRRDIYHATQNRQAAVRGLSRLVDMVFAVGAKIAPIPVPYAKSPGGWSAGLLDR